MFKRRKQRTRWEATKEFFYPRTGWCRAIEYVGHRLKRLPDTPHRIALGLACGTLVCYTPFFGLHFFLAAGLAIVLRGNVLSSLMGTFFGNPLTFPIIAAVSYRLGLFILGMGPEETAWSKLRKAFSDAFNTMWANFKALFGYEPSVWTGFVEFFHSVFLPYLVGGLAPGIITGIVTYFVSKPLIAAYQNRRKGRLLAKFKEIAAKRKGRTGED